MGGFQDKPNLNDCVIVICTCLYPGLRYERLLYLGTSVLLPLDPEGLDPEVSQNRFMVANKTTFLRLVLCSPPLSAGPFLPLSIVFLRQSIKSISLTEIIHPSP